MPEHADAAAAGDSCRVFFALWPDAATASRLHRIARALQAHCGGRVMRRDTLHLTLAFIGEIPVARLPALLDLAARVDGERFTMKLDRLGGWSHKHLLWAAPQRVPAALDRLAGELRLVLEAGGFPTEKRPFAPHVTLVRNVRHDAVPDTGADEVTHWQAGSFVLAGSQRFSDGARYRMLGRWSLS